MRVRLTIDVDEAARYVIAKYFAPAGDGADKTRSRATRAQARRFALAAFRQATREQANALRGRLKATARRLSEGAVPDPEPLREPDERQQELQW